ncbi:hypothetical protein Tco_0211742 [Tanacetum coccineum]
MRPPKALTAVQTMANHSHKCHDDTTSRKMGSSNSNDGLAALVNKLDNLGRDMKKLNESVYAIQAKQDEWLKTFCHNLEKSQNHHDEIIQGLKSRVTTLAKESVTKIDNNEDCKAIFTNDGAPLYTPFYYSPEEIEYFSANSGFLDDDELKNVTSIPDPTAINLEMKTLNKSRCSALILTKLHLEREKSVSLSPAQLEVNYDDIDDFYDPDQCEESRNNEIRERIIHNLHEEWFKGTSDDEDDIEGIIDYLEPTSYDGFIDLDEEEYNKRRCRLLGMPYIAPLLLIIEQVKITRYSLGPGEVYTKVEVLNMEKLPWTRNNIATIRHDIMDEVFERYEELSKNKIMLALT